MKRTSVRIITGFALLIATGSVLLYFFGYRETHQKLWIDTLFTAVSGVCVTGLTVMDISRELNFQGQVILVVLIQIGGLGVLTLSNWLTLYFRGKLKLIQVDSTNKTLGALAKLPPAVFIRRIIVLTFACEFIGAFILFFCFLPNHNFNDSIWLAIFHSISAFCNAGFSLFSNNLESYNSHVIINITFMLLIFLGGIGFLVITDIYEYFKSLLKKRNSRLTLQSKISLSASGWLILSGTVLVYFFDYNNFFKKEPFLSGILEAVFLSVTSRTAGFNTIPIGNLTSMSLTTVIILMMIGASSGSTGGGIKTSTAAVFWALMISNFRKKDNVEIFSRTIAYHDISKVISIIFLYIITVIVGVTLLQIFETSGLDPRTSRATFMEHAFEVVSALSTVGLSTGITPSLSPPGKIIIMACMFAGRVGLLAVVASVIGRQQKLLYKYPVENIMVG